MDAYGCRRERMLCPACSDGLTGAILAHFADGHVLENVLHVGTVGQRAWRWQRCGGDADTVVVLQPLHLLTLVSVQDEYELLLYQPALLGEKLRHHTSCRRR